eukprot:1337366-Rhodomonas_salina.1
MAIQKKKTVHLVPGLQFFSFDFAGSIWLPAQLGGSRLRLGYPMLRPVGRKRGRSGRKRGSKTGGKGSERGRKGGRIGRKRGRKKGRIKGR